MGVAATLPELSEWTLTACFMDNKRNWIFHFVFISILILDWFDLGN